MKAVSWTLRIILIALIIFAVYAITTAHAKKTWDTEYPMTNQKIEWRYAK